MLNGTELNILFSQVFGYSATDCGHRIGFLVDVPTQSSDDTKDWRERRELTMRWARSLAQTAHHACMVYAYESVGRNNAELVHPLHGIILTENVPNTASELNHHYGEIAEPEDVYSRAEFWIALTQYSATAPLKMAAARYGFKAATMPGFTLSMLPALSINVNEIDARVTKLANALTQAHTAVLIFDVHGSSYELTLDLRYRLGFASSGRFTMNGQAGNLPSGEAYIVPYEGETLGILSSSSGILPIERDGEIALCEVSENRVVCVDGANAWADELRQSVELDPARANVAELGLGVLGEWGIEAVGHILLDEKLALHIALGRSEHLGGVTSPSDFKSPSHVSHIDYVFHPRLMPDIRITKGILMFDDGEVEFVSNDRYQYDRLN